MTRDDGGAACEGKDRDATVLADVFRSFHELEAIVRKDVLDLDAIMALFWLQGEWTSTAGRLSRSLRFSPSKTTRCLKRLVSLGLVEECLDDKDLRKCYFKLANKGENVAFEVARAFGKERMTWQLRCFRELRAAACLASASWDGGSITAAAERLLLVLLHAAPSGLTVGDVCKATCMAQPKVSMSLKALEKRGAVEFGPHGEDGRMRCVRLTRMGRRVASNMMNELGFLDDRGPTAP